MFENNTCETNRLPSFRYEIPDKLNFVFSRGELDHECFYFVSILKTIP